MVCAQARNAFMQLCTDSRQPTLTPELARHIAQCPVCQQARADVFATLLPGGDAPAGQCDYCQDDLAAYVDAVIDAGSHSAALAYPHICWHLWACVDCAEVFAQTAALVTAERMGELPPLPVARAPIAIPDRRVIGRLFIASEVITHMQQSRALLGVAYGSEAPVILDARTDGDYSFNLSIAHMKDGVWQVLVSVAPPITGVAVVTIGAYTLQAAFDLRGVAEITGVLAALLTDSKRAIAVSVEAT